ncbi:chromate transporter [Eubacteriaceae bacterium ES3]|nr:chromate transporter [Eubacteriaceae bacterium ES3]
MDEKKKENLWTVFATFFKIGLFTFGGGYAMISLIEYEMVERHHWIESEDIVDMIAIAEATPGVISVNTATFVGYKIGGGMVGSIAATFGVVLPSLLIISVIATFFESFQKILWVQYAFQGIRAGISVLVLGAAIKLGKKGEYHLLTVATLIVSFIVAVFTDLNVIFLIIGGGLIGILHQVVLNKAMIQDNKENHDIH